jgi:hypothetical protein
MSEFSNGTAALSGLSGADFSRYQHHPVDNVVDNPAVTARPLARPSSVESPWQPSNKYP